MAEELNCRDPHCVGKCGLVYSMTAGENHCRRDFRPQLEHAIPGDLRLERIPWDTYFLGIANAVAQRGSCRRKKVGAILVDDQRVVVGTGYNGAPRGLPDCMQAGCDVRVIDGRESCVRTIHAESNAIDFAWRHANNVTLYSNVIPCRLCALRIIQTGITRVVYSELYLSQGTAEVPALFSEAGIILDHCDDAGAIRSYSDGKLVDKVVTR